MRKFKEILNEGSWGYEPDENDGTLDLRDDILLAMCEMVYDKCSVKPNRDSAWSEAQLAWEELGEVEFFFEEFSKIDNFGVGDGDFNKYYFWWYLNKKKNKDIVVLYERLLDICKKDEKWIGGWKEPEKMRESLKKRDDILDRLKKLQKNRNKYERKHTKNVDEHNNPEHIKESVDNLKWLPDVKTLGNGSFEGILWGHCFLYNEQKYYSECGWKNIYPSYCKMVIENNEAFPHQVDIYQRPNLKDLFNE